MMSFSESLFARALRWLAHAVCTHPNWFIYPQFALFILCVVYTVFNLQLDMNRDNLIGPRNRAHQIHQRFRAEFPGEDELAVVVESENQERNRQFVERLGARIAQSTNLFEQTFYKGNIASLGPKALLLVPESDLEEMRKALHDYKPMIQQFTQATNLVSFFALVNRQFRTATPGPKGSAETLIDALPFFQRLIDQGRESLFRRGPPPSPGVETILGGGEQAQQQMYLSFSEGRIYLLTTRPRHTSLAPQAIERIREYISQTEFEVPGVNVGLTGQPVLDYDEMRQSERDSIKATIIALVLCSLIFIGGYREVSRPLKAALCLVMGIGYTMGFTTLVIGHLNILTISFAPMLIGLGIDFGIHLITRHEEEIRRGRPTQEAISKAMIFTGQGIVTGAFTTAAAFLAMALTRFKGIQEMGLICGGGLLLCLVPMMTVLPALLLRGREDTLDRQQGPAAERRVRIENLWLQRPWTIIGITALLCGLSAWQFHRVYFDYNLIHMQSKGLPSVIAEQKLIEEADRSVIFGRVMADSAAQARAYAEQIRKLPAVASVESAADYLTEDQTRKLELVRAIKNQVADLHFAPLDTNQVDLTELNANLWYTMGYLGLGAQATRTSDPALSKRLVSLYDSIAAFRKDMLSEQPQIPRQLYLFQRAFFNDLHQTFNALRSQDTSGPMRAQDLPPMIRNRYIGASGKFLLDVLPKKDLWQHDNQREFINQLLTVVPRERLDGTPIGLYNYTTLLKNSYQEAAYYALAAIVIAVLIHFRSLLAVVLSLLPVAIGACWLLGFMGATNHPFNPANIIILPLMVGIGVTNGIHILNRFAEEQRPGILARSTGKAVLVSGLTTIVGFASLTTAKHLGIQSLGVVLSTGIAACMIAGLTFLPSLMMLMHRRGWRIKLREKKKEDYDYD